MNQQPQWMGSVDDPDRDHLALPASSTALCKIPVDASAGEPVLDRQCGECNFELLVLQGKVRVLGLRQGSLAAF